MAGFYSRPHEHRVVTAGPDPEIDSISILRVFLGSTDPAFVPSEIAEDLDCTTEGARHQMNQLVERGLLTKKKPGQRTVLYWVTDEGKQHYFEQTTE